MSRPKDFSVELQEYINQPKGERTIAELGEVFGNKSAAIGIMVLMALPALPIPTGGVSHVFEIIAIFLAAGMIISSGRFWVPKRYQKTRLTGKNQERFFRGLIGFIAFFERFSSPRLPRLVNSGIIHRLSAVLVIIFSLFAFFSPPFSFLDTLPAMGAVIMMLALVLEDALLLLIGVLLGTFGCVLAFVIASSVYKALLSFI